MRKTPAWILIAVACAAQFLVVLDVSIVNVALPAIRADLGFGVAGLEWVVNAYAITFAGFLLLGGRLADVFGSTRMFAIGLSVFVAASLIGGLAGSPELLIGARAAQGLGAALLSPTTLTVLLSEFPRGRLRVTALATWSAVGSVGGASGAMLGGVFTDFLSWRWVLLVNLPIGAVILLISRFVLYRGVGGVRSRLDTLAALSVTLGLAALAYGFSSGPTHGWSSWQSLGAFGLALTALSWFLLLQSQKSRDRLMPLELFRRRSLSLGSTLMLLAGAVVFPLWYFVSLYLQEVAGHTPIETGFAFLPHTLAMILGSRLSPMLLRIMSARALVISGSWIAVAGFLIHAQITASTPLILGVLLPGALACFGISLTFTPLSLTATAKVGPEHSGLVSGVLNTTRQVGVAIGLAALTGITMTTDFESGVPELSADGLPAVFISLAVGSALLAGGALFLPKVDDFSTETPRLATPQKG